MLQDSIRSPQYISCLVIIHIFICDDDAVEFTSFDIACMQRALELAKTGASAAEVPIGAVLVRDDEIIGEGWNAPVSEVDPTAHAEIVALRAAARSAGNYRLMDTTLYVTLEPCLMCAGAIANARVAQVIYAAPDIRWGARHQLPDSQVFCNHRVVYNGGLLAEESVQLLRDFFAERR